MTRRTPSRQVRLAALVTATTALDLSAAMSASYARPFGTGGYGGYRAISAIHGR